MGAGFAPNPSKEKEEKEEKSKGENQQKARGVPEHEVWVGGSRDVRSLERLGPGDDDNDDGDGGCVQKTSRKPPSPRPQTSRCGPVFAPHVRLSSRNTIT